MDFDLDFVNPEPQAEGLDENEEGEGLDQPQRGEKLNTNSGKRSEEILENTQWRKAKQMQPM